jgi:thioredoxin 2
VPADRLDAHPKCGRCGAGIEIDGLSNGRAEMVTDGNFDTTVLKSPLPVLMFCWAPWCPTCKTNLPTVDTFARETKGRVRVAKLNVDQNQLLAQKFKILSVPTYLIFDGGRLRENLAGQLPAKHELMLKMGHYI